MSYAGAAAGVVGGFMQSVAATMESQAMFQAFQAELARQHGYNDQAYGAFLGSLPGQSAESANDQITQGQDQRMQSYGQLQATPLVAGGSANSLGANDAAALNLSDASRSRVGGYGDWKVDQTISNIKTQDQLNKISNFAAGTASVFPYQMYAAQHSQDELDMWGKAISSIGGGSFSPSASAPSGATGSPSSSQMAAFNAGQGPVSQQYANTWQQQPMFNSYGAPMNNSINLSGVGY